MFLHFRRILTFRNMIPTAHRAKRVRTPMKQLIHRAGLLGDNWEANHTSLLQSFQEEVVHWMMLKCFFLSPWKLAAAAFARFCTGKLPSTHWMLAQALLLQAPTWKCVQPGEVPSDTTPQCCNCQPWSVCLFRDPSSTWQCSKAHESMFSLTYQAGHSFYNMKQQQKYYF